MSDTTVDLLIDEINQVSMTALQKLGVPDGDALQTVRMLLWADVRGYASHGIERLPVYAKRLKLGLINPRPNITVRPVGQAMELVDGDSGLGQVVASRGIERAMTMARKTGLALACCKNSNHFGSAAPYALTACEEKLICICATNAFPTMPPTGAIEAVVGNNPICIGAPMAGDVHFLLDMAMSVSSRGRIRARAAAGETIPLGWALDQDGVPTQDPNEALKGIVLPVGLHKGYGLAVAIDILCGVITGAGYGPGVKSLYQQWETSQNVGHLFIVVDPCRFLPWPQYVERLSDLYRLLRGAKRISPEQPILIPGEKESAQESEHRRSGLRLPVRLWEQLKDLAAGGYDFELSRY